MLGPWRRRDVLSSLPVDIFLYHDEDLWEGACVRFLWCRLAAHCVFYCFSTADYDLTIGLWGCALICMGPRECYPNIMLGFTLLPCPFCGICPFSTIEIRWFRRFSYPWLTNSGTSFFVGSIPPVAEISVLCLVCVVFVAPRKKPCRCGDELYFWCLAFYHFAYCLWGRICGVLCLTDWFVTRETTRMNFVPGLCSVQRPDSND